MSVNDLLSLSGEALRAYQSRINVVSQNIAHVETDGYSRRTQEISPLVDGRGNPVGIQIGDVTRCHSALSASALLQEESTLAFYSESAELLRSLETYNGGRDGGLSAALQEFENAWQNVSDNPEDLAVRTVLLQKAASLSTEFNNLSARYTSFSNTVAASGGLISQSVDEINSLTSRLEELNKSITQADAMGRAVPALQDERDQLVSELSTLANVSVSPIYQVSLGGMELVSADGLSRQTLDATLPTTFSVGGVDVSALISGGKLAAQVEAYTTVESMQSRLDQLAQTLSSEINTLFDSGYNLDGASPADEGYTFFTGTGAADLALDTALLDPSDPMSGNPSRIAAAATRASAGPPPIPNSGDSTIARAIGEQLDGAHAALGGQTVLGFWSDTETMLASAISEADEMAASSTVLVDALTERVQSQSGINMDEELVDLLSAQRSYEACSRVFSTATSLLDTLMQLV